MVGRRYATDTRRRRSPRGNWQSSSGFPGGRWIGRWRRSGRLPQELAKLRRYKLLIVDEVGYIPFDQDSANLFFQLVSSRYEHASLVLTSNLAFSRWGEVFSDATVASAMIDRIVHHAEVLNLTGSSYRLRNKTRTQLQAQ